MFRVTGLFILPFAFLAIWAGSARAQDVEAYIFRGAGDFTFIADRLSFSEGMDNLGDKIRAAGMHAAVYRWEAGEFAYREIMRRKPQSVALIGHSMGALTALALAGRLKKTDIRVAYLGTIDIPGPVGATPGNVEVAENFYHAFPVFGQLTAGPRHKGKISNHFVWGQIHITMDNSKKVHGAILAAIDAARGSPDIMQAYSAEPPEDTIAKVDQVITGATSHDGAVSEAEQRVAGGDDPNADSRLVALIDPVEHDPLSAQAHVDSVAVPVPTPRPRQYDTASGLRPIE